MKASLHLWFDSLFHPSSSSLLLRHHHTDGPKLPSIIQRTTMPVHPRLHPWCYTTHTQKGSASSLGRIPVSLASIGSLRFSVEQKLWASGFYMSLQGLTLALSSFASNGKKLWGVCVIFDEYYYYHTSLSRHMLLLAQAWLCTGAQKPKQAIKGRERRGWANTRKKLLERSVQKRGFDSRVEANKETRGRKRRMDAQREGWTECST